MAKKINVTNFEELNKQVQEWFWEDYLPKTDKVELANNSGYLHFMMCFLDMMEGYAVPNLEPEYESDVEEGLIDIGNNLLFQYFNEGNTLEDLASIIFSFNHLEEYDPFGQYSYEGVWEVTIIAVQEYYKQKGGK